MPLSPGRRLGPYEIVAPIGSGAMGEIFRARDTRLRRDVAVKVLRAHLTEQPAVRARFEREARTISALNHPHICVLYDVGRDGDIDYLVLELLEGETLAARLLRGALPFDEVVAYGAQIADALDRAHSNGFVHRDLKPGNIMLTPSGVKLLDFGLARAIRPLEPAGLRESRTGSTIELADVSESLTVEGTIVGTFQYMAPECLDGHDADPRADLWALGCVLYEMATGRTAFAGSTPASLIGAIMRDHPEPIAGEMSPGAAPSGVLSHVDRLVGDLLAKDPDERLSSAGEVRRRLLAASAAGDTTPLPDVRPAPRAGSSVPRSRASSLRLLGVLLGVLAAVLVWRLWPGGGAPATNLERLRLTVQAPTDLTIGPAGHRLAISPDGRSVAFAAADSAGTMRLYVRDLSDLSVRAIAGTEHGDQPFWSPDNRWLGFFAGGKLRKIPVTGGSSEPLADAPDPRGGAWGAGGSIVFAPMAAGPLFAVPADGGAIVEVARPDSAQGETGLRFPSFLPDGERFLFVALPRAVDGYAIHLGRVDAGDREFVLRANASPVYAAPGHLITTQGARIVAQPFDARSGRVTGAPITIGPAPPPSGAEGERVATAAGDGSLAYWSGRLVNTRLHWLDREGRPGADVPVPPARWSRVDISPDGRKALLLRRDSGFDRDLWILDFETGQTRRLTFEPSVITGLGIWSPDGSRVLYTGLPRGRTDLFVRPATGGEPELLLATEHEFLNIFSWSPDDAWITFEAPLPETGWDVWGVAMNDGRRLVPFENGPAQDGGGWFSRNGRWLACYSNESGKYETYVRGFPEAGVRVPIPGTAVGGTERGSPCWWSADGRELLFIAGGSVRAAEVDTGERFRVLGVRELFPMPREVAAFAPTPGHDRFLVAVPAEAEQEPAIVIDKNWIAGSD
jgi:serine/threonine protein kinase